MPLDKQTIYRIRQRLEAYPEYRDIIHTPDRDDVTAEDRYLLCVEALLNRCERVEGQLTEHLNPPPKIKPSPAFTCGNCGEQEYLHAAFSPANFERQQKQFTDKHKDCRPAVDGGGI